MNIKELILANRETEVKFTGSYKQYLTYEGIIDGKRFYVTTYEYRYEYEPVEVLGNLIDATDWDCGAIG